MSDEPENTNTLPFDRQRNSERRQRQRAAHTRTTRTNARQRARSVTLVLLVVVALLGVWDIRMGVGPAGGRAAPTTNAAFGVHTAHTTPAHDQVAVPNVICGTDGITTTTGTLIVAP